MKHYDYKKDAVIELLTKALPWKLYFHSDEVMRMEARNLIKRLMGKPFVFSHHKVSKRLSLSHQEFIELAEEIGAQHIKKMLAQDAWPVNKPTLIM